MYNNSYEKKKNYILTNQRVCINTNCIDLGDFRIKSNFIPVWFNTIYNLFIYACTSNLKQLYCLI